MKRPTVLISLGLLSLAYGQGGNIALQGATAMNGGRVEVRLRWVPQSGWMPQGGVTVWRSVGNGAYQQISPVIDLASDSGSTTAIAALRGAPNSSLPQSFKKASVRLSSWHYFGGLKTVASQLKSQGFGPAQIKVGLAASHPMQEYLNNFTHVKVSGSPVPLGSLKKLNSGGTTITALPDPSHFRAQVVLQAMTHPALAAKYGLGFTDPNPPQGAVNYELFPAVRTSATAPALAQVTVQVDPNQEMKPPIPTNFDGLQTDQTTVDLHWEPLIDPVIGTKEEPKLGILSYVVERLDPTTKAWGTISREPVIMAYRPTNIPGTVIAPPTSFIDSTAPLGAIQYRVTAYDSFGRPSSPVTTTVQVDDLRTPNPIYRLVSRGVPPGQPPTLGGNGLQLNLGSASNNSLQTEGVIFFLPVPPVIPTTTSSTGPSISTLNKSGGTSTQMQSGTPLTPAYHVYRRPVDNNGGATNKIHVVLRQSLTPLGSSSAANSSDMTLQDFCTLFGINNLTPAYKNYVAALQQVVFDSNGVTSLTAQIKAATKALQQGSTGTGPQQTTASKTAALTNLQSLLGNLLLKSQTDATNVTTQTTALNGALASVGSMFGWTPAQLTAVEGVIEASGFTSQWSSTQFDLISIYALMGGGKLLHGNAAANPVATSAWQIALNQVQEYMDPSPQTDTFQAYSVSSLYTQVNRESVQVTSKPVPIPLYVAPGVPAQTSANFSVGNGQFGFLDLKGNIVHEPKTLPQGTNSLLKLSKMTKGPKKLPLMDVQRFQNPTDFLAPSNGTIGGAVTINWAPVKQTATMRYDVYRAINSGWINMPAPPTYYLDLPSGNLNASSWVKLGETQQTTWTDTLTRSNATHYLYHVVAVNRWGVAGAACPDMPVHVPGLRPPSVPSVVSVNPGELGGIKLIWRPTPADEQVNKYLVLRQTVPLNSTSNTTTSVASPQMFKTKNSILDKYGLNTKAIAVQPTWLNLTAPGVAKTSPGKRPTLTLTDTQLKMLDVTGYQVVGTVPFNLTKYSANPLEFLDTTYPNPIPGQQYLYRMMAVNSDGVASDGSLPVDAEPLRMKADPVSNLSAAASAAGQPRGVVLNWTKPTTTASNYLIYRQLVIPATISGSLQNPSQIQATAPQVGPLLLLTTILPPDGVLARLPSTFVDTAVRTGQTYTYQVVVRDFAGRLSDPVLVNFGPVAHP